MGNLTGHTPASPGSPLGPPAAQKLGLGWRCKPKIAAEMLLPQHVQDGTGMEASARHTPTALGRRPEPTPQLEMGKTPRDDGKDAPRGTVAAGRGYKVWFRSPSSTSNPSYFMQSHRQHPSRGMPVFLQGGRPTRTSAGFAGRPSHEFQLSPAFSGSKTKSQTYQCRHSTAGEPGVTELSINTSRSSALLARSTGSHHGFWPRSYTDLYRC